MYNLPKNVHLVISAIHLEWIKVYILAHVHVMQDFMMMEPVFARVIIINNFFKNVHIDALIA